VGACRDLDLEERTPACGVVGLFDSTDDREVAGQLFETAEGWLRERGCTSARGPLNYSIHDTAGLLVEGIDTPPVVDTTWNPAYYAGLWEARGWEPAIETLGAEGPVGAPSWERAHRFARRAERRGISVRRLDMSRFKEEVERIRILYNDAWEGNWGHVPVGKEEFAFKAKDLEPAIGGEMVHIAECDGKPVGFMLCLPDFNVPIKRSGGRLLPLGWLRLLRARRTVKRCRVAAMGVVPGYRNRGVEALLMSRSLADLESLFSWVEASWILADNAAMINSLQVYSLEPYKRWRIYEKRLPAVS
jgi:GNAT superfamily N-acetyltransferase